MIVCLKVDEKEYVDKDNVDKNVIKPAEPVDDAKNKASWDCHNRPANHILQVLTDFDGFYCV